ncbi:putative BPI/LBP family protein At1g04970 isoform X1 [Olea europaea var. sylvestris]|uniref:putative BPI/LBP family protein At1g04970 isoform X1 n=1 Tax=Olea europaea var. sylvestris TaxID=158386 RepID=UPI000C1D0ED7|nr:putative BPI/LBP family protein At1g04970 isoform X1 [Olea europaea var. sylvestris]
MARSIFIFVIFFLISFCYTHVRSNDQEGYITVDISNKGLDFLKDLLIEKAESSLLPLYLPKIEKAVKIPIVGKVHMVLSNITMERIDVISSTVKTDDNGILIAVSGATANLSMNWKYSYSTWLIPIAVSDQGSATIRVEDMDIGLTLSLKNLQGSLMLSVQDCGCNVKDISIKLDGGASLVYQGLVDAFEGKIVSAVENAVSKKIKGGIVKLDSVLQSLPKEVPITNIASMNITFVDDPKLSESSLDVEIDGLLSAKDKIIVSNHYHKTLQASFSYREVDKMARISLHEGVLKSASAVYFKAKKMHWIVDNISDQSLLNTASWRFIIPQLYKMYPNDEINLNISVSSLPTIKIEKQQIDVTIPLDVVIDVLDAGEVIPVAGFSMVISASISAEISGNTLFGRVKLNQFSMSLKWSKIGDLHMRLVQSVISTMLKTVILPYVNVQLRKGHLLPAFHGYKLQDTQIVCVDSWIIISSDLASAKRFRIA